MRPQNYTIMIIVCGLVASQINLSHAQNDDSKSLTAIELLRKQEARRARETEERIEYLRETDALIKSIRTTIFEIRLAMTEIQYSVENFKCSAVESFERDMQRQIEYLQESRAKVVERCVVISPLNVEGQSICKSQINDIDHQIAQNSDIEEIKNYFCPELQNIETLEQVKE